jgi:fructuronate reductase
MGRIVHIGLGNFHRAHQAWYTAQAGSWAITAVSLRSRTLRDALAGQDNGYTLVTRGADGTRYDWLTVIDRVLVAPEDPEAVLTALADPGVGVVTVTVTEKGYHLDASGRLDFADPAIAADLAGGAPETLVGYLGRGLARRQTPVTVLSCDNLSGNGVRLGAAVRAFAARAGLTLGTVSFPDSMVDRITPATTEALMAEVLAQTGRPDAAPVATETFTDWVIEDRFCAHRPTWDAHFVAEVAPYEMRKLRMLNGPHSLIAYLGQLRGHTFVHEAIADPVVRAAAEGLMTEAMTTLPQAVAADAPAYADALIDRFANPALRHELRQIAMDGSVKLPVRILPVIAARAALGQGAPHALNGLAAWVAYVRREAAAGRLLNDPKAAAIAAAAKAPDPIGGLVRLLGMLPDAHVLVEIEKLSQGFEP